MPPSIYRFLRAELSRGYQLELDKERYVARREKVYTFMKIPRELEKFMSYGFFQCTDSFLFIYTFLPLRFVLALWALVTRPILRFFSPSKIRHKRILQPSEIVDILKGFIIIVCIFILSYLDMAMMYHMIKSQSVIKLYLFFNMLEVGDRLFSVFGQDIVDALYWTATETKGRKREHLGVIPHLIMAVIYVLAHTVLVLFQATTLNVAINSSNKALLTIMMSNNFVELKSSVFKKFDKNNLFQLSCADVRERFHLFVLLLIVVVQTMKEYSWKEERFWVLLPDCLMVLFAEVLVDWIKHAFVTRFNEIPSITYREYTLSLAYDLAQTKHKNAFSEHSDLVARRMGFIPLPLGVLAARIISQAVKISNVGGAFLLMLAFLCLLSFRILSNIITLGKACDLIDNHQRQRSETAAEVKNDKCCEASSMCSSTRMSKSDENVSSQDAAAREGDDTFDEGPPIVRSMSFDVADLEKSPGRTLSILNKFRRRKSHSPPNRNGISSSSGMQLKEVVEFDSPEGLTAQFSNSSVSLTSVCLNEELFQANVPQHSQQRASID